jgi:hypothetical protein
MARDDRANDSPLLLADKTLKYHDREPTFSPSCVTHPSLQMSNPSITLSPSCGGIHSASTRSSIRSTRADALPAINQRTSRRARIAAHRNTNDATTITSSSSSSESRLPPRSKSYDDSHDARARKDSFQHCHDHDDRPTVSTPRSAPVVDKAESAVASRPPTASVPTVRRQSTAPPATCNNPPYGWQYSNSSNTALYARQYSNGSSSNNTTNSMSTSIRSTHKNGRSISNLDQAEAAVASRPPTAIGVPMVRRQHTAPSPSSLFARQLSNNSNSAPYARQYSNGSNNNNTSSYTGASSTSMQIRRSSTSGGDYSLRASQVPNCGEGSPRRYAGNHEGSDPSQSSTYRDLSPNQRNSPAAYGRSKSNPDSAVHYSRHYNRNNHYDPFNNSRRRGDITTPPAPARVRRHMSHDPPRIVTSKTTAAHHQQRSFHLSKSNRRSTDAAIRHPNAIMVDVEPGVCAPLRSGQDTTDAIGRNFLAETFCLSCTIQLYCIANAQFYICPVCRVVSPLLSGNDGEHGVALGFTEETLKERQWQHQQPSNGLRIE